MGGGGNEVSGAVTGSVVQAGVINGDVHLHQAAPLRRPTAVLPPPATFVGRAAELAFLTARSDRVDSTAGPVITLLTGTAGVGKTALAVHWAHRSRDRFPDGQLHVDLRGFDHRGPVHPAAALRGFFLALDVPKERVPDDLDAQVTLFHRLLAGRRVLLLLDNARDTDQVRPLLPTGPGCVVLVTSRRRLDSLVAREQAAHLNVALPSAKQAREILLTRLGSREVSRDDPAVDELVRRCARLPIALAVAAAQATVRPSARLDDLVTELAELSTADSADTDVPTVFALSYQALTDHAARLFRLLGPHPGPDFATEAAASLIGLPVARTRPLVQQLAAASLVEELPGGRYRFHHDLLRDYAVELAATEPERRSAELRLFDCYLHTAIAADRLLYPHRDPIPVRPPLDGVTVTAVRDHDEAWAWFTVERTNLLTTLGQAVRAGADDHVWRLPWALSSYLGRVGSWHDWLTGSQAGLAAARRIGDPRAEATMLRIIGRVHTLTGDHPSAEAALLEALRVSSRLADVGGQAHTHQAISLAHERAGNLDDARLHAELSVALAEAAGHEKRVARALNQLGRVLSVLGEHGAALKCCTRAVDVLTRLDDRSSLADAAESLGRVHHGLGDPVAAIRQYRRALRIYRDFGDLWSQVEVLRRVADAYLDVGRDDRAAKALAVTLDLCTEIDHPDTEEVRTLLTATSARVATGERDAGARPARPPRSGADR
ncbi:ATP-binding protein [Saccharothrix saharensis]|uniref:ATP-binding protein n=1 Tax=Saccharothrix saharensis TaxID=571190 RepID=UPI00368A96DD